MTVLGIAPSGLYGRRRAMQALHKWMKEEYGEGLTDDKISDIGIACSDAYDPQEHRHTMQWWLEAERPRLVLHIDDTLTGVANFENWDQLAWFIEDYLTFDLLIDAAEQALAGNGRITL